MKKLLLTLAIFSLFLPGALAAGRTGPVGFSMGQAVMGGLPGPETVDPCFVVLSTLDLTPETRANLEGSLFDLQKNMIRSMADLKILSLETTRLFENRNFDMKTAQAKLTEISQKTADLYLAHLSFLHELSGVLTDAQWERLMEAHNGRSAFVFGRGTPMPFEGIAPGAVKQRARPGLKSTRRDFNQEWYCDAPYRGPRGPKAGHDRDYRRHHMWDNDYYDDDMDDSTLRGWMWRNQRTEEEGDLLDSDQAEILQNGEESDNTPPQRMMNEEAIRNEMRRFWMEKNGIRGGTSNPPPMADPNPEATPPAEEK